MFTKLIALKEKAASFVRGATLAVGAFVVSALAVGSHPASAAIDPSVALALTSVQTDATTLNGMVVPAMMIIIAMFVVIRLIRKFTNKVA